MATGGGPRASVRGSDDWYPFMCSRCFRKELDVGAEVYCLQCEEYFCWVCHNNHNTFAKMAAHTMLDRHEMEATGPRPIQPLLREPCDQHQGEVYNMFCKEHNKVCCVVCSRIYHTFCDVGYILDVTKGPVQMREMCKLRRDVEVIMKHVEKVKEQRHFDLQMITAKKTFEVNNIHVCIQKMVRQLHTIEASAVDDVAGQFIEYKTKIEHDLTELETMIEILETKLDKLEKAVDDTEKFVHLKICEAESSSACCLIEDIEARVGDEKLVFLIDDHVKEVFRKLQSLGQLMLDYRYDVTLATRHSVNTIKDKTICDVQGMCLAADGSLLVADSSNRCLKRLDQKYNVIDRMKLGHSPQGVCSVSASQAAVCMRFSKTVQMITLDSTMSKSTSFKTTDYCSGIAYHADHLYVTCGGLRVEGEGTGHIAVYTITGILVRKLETYTGDTLLFSTPMDVAVRSNDDVILVCDGDNGLVALRSNGKRMWALTCRSLGMNTYVNRVTVDSYGQALVGSVCSNKVVLVSREGRNLGELRTTRDGIKKPNALCFDSQRSLLTVGMIENNQISVFKLDNKI